MGQDDEHKGLMMAQQNIVVPPQIEEENEMDAISHLFRSGEMDALIQLKMLEYKRDTSSGSQLIAHRRGNRETSSDYETQLYNTARNFITTELRSGVDVNTLFERLSPLWRQARFEDPHPNTRTTGSNTIPIHSKRRVNEFSKNTSR